MLLLSLFQFDVMSVFFLSVIYVNDVWIVVVTVVNRMVYVNAWYFSEKIPILSYLILSYLGAFPGIFDPHSS